MKFCRTCSVPMVGVMSFSKNKREKYNRCPKCYSESKRRFIFDSELTFGEILQKEYRKTGF